MLMNSIGGLMGGGHRQGFGDASSMDKEAAAARGAAISRRAISPARPASTTSAAAAAADAMRMQAAGRASFDQASNESDDEDDEDYDSDGDFDSGDSDYA